MATAAPSPKTIIASNEHGFDAHCDRLKTQYALRENTHQQLTPSAHAPTMANDTPERPSPEERQRQRNLRQLKYHKEKGDIITPAKMSRFSQLLAEDPLFMVPKKTKSPRHRDTRADSAQLGGGVDEDAKADRPSLRDSLRNAPILNREGRKKMAYDLGAGRSPTSDELVVVPGRRKRMANDGKAGRQLAGDPAIVVPEEEDDDLKAGISPASDAPVAVPVRRKKTTNDGTAGRQRAGDPPVVAPERRMKMANDGKDKTMPAEVPKPKRPNPQKPRTEHGDPTRALVERRLKELERERWDEITLTASKAEREKQGDLYRKLGFNADSSDPTTAQANTGRWDDILRKNDPRTRLTEEQEQNRQLLHSMLDAPPEADPAKVIEQLDQLKVGTNSGRS